ncbi:hypothetical protein MSAN_02137600 [Mycena sanguinolenta]|uniref:Uncharacterized protein n=1 Tax=Mycena sanguinolenta TaxID=230812 RepID=A0A8H6XHJ4_9AGAR|nr:hypothetical protein MSAN_02137600 [Mycena sanguinolenta]
MAAVLSSTYLGAGAAGIQLDNGDTRIYYQDADGAIYQIGGMGSPVSGTKYSPGLKALLVPADKVRVNTPWRSPLGAVSTRFASTISTETIKFTNSVMASPATLFPELWIT